MAKKRYRAVVVIGQSNGSNNGDAKSWDDENPVIAIRSANTNTGFIPQYAQGSATEKWRMAGEFPGGRTIDQLGQVVQGQWQEVNTRGRVIGGVHFPVFYNPSAYFSTNDTFANGYPGSCEISFVETPVQSTYRFLTNHQIQEAQWNEVCTSIAGDEVTVSAGSPTVANGDLVAFKAASGGTLPVAISVQQVFRVRDVGVAGANKFEIDKWPQILIDPANATVNATGGTPNYQVHRTSLGTITRQRTGTTHIAAGGCPGSSGTTGRLHMSVYPAFTDPIPVIGERIDFPITLGEAASVSGFSHTTAGPMLFRTRFGGLCDSGGSLSSNCRIRTPWVSATSLPRPVVVTVPAEDIYEGRPILLSEPSGFAGTLGAGANITYSGVAVQVDDRVVFGGFPPAELTVGTVYFVVSVSQQNSTMQVSATKGGSAISCSSTGGITATVTVKLPAWVNDTTVYYISRLYPTAWPPVAGTITLISSSSQLLRLDGHDLLEHEELVLESGSSIPSQFIVGKSYFVRLVDANTVHLYDRAAGGSIFTWTHSNAASLTFRRNEQLISCRISEQPGGPEIVATANGEDGFTCGFMRTVRFEGSLTGVTCRCVSGTAANVGKRVKLKHIEYDVPNDISYVYHDDEWPAAPTDADVFVFEPPPVNGKDVPWDQWCEILPWCPFEGLASGGLTFSGMLNTGPAIPNSSGEIGLPAVGVTSIGDAVAFYSTDARGILPNRMIPGQTYFVTQAAANAFFFSEEYDGSNFVPTGVTCTSVASNQITAAGHLLTEDYPIAFYGTNMPAEITEGARYYAHVISANVLEVRQYEGGSSLTLTPPSGTLDMALYFPGSTSSTVTCLRPQSGRSNPFPPGFNYPGHVYLLDRYQPFNGPGVSGIGGSALSWSWALKVAARTGEDVLVLNLAFGGTSLGRKEVIPGGILDGSATGIASVNGYAWVDLKQQICWSENDTNGCYQRLVDEVDGINLALERSNAEVVLEGICWIQAEEDSVYEALANSYQDHLHTFKATVRQMFKDKGWWSGSASKIPWMQPQPLESYGNFPEVVAAAIEAETDIDTYARVIEAGDALEKLHDLYNLNADTVHYSGRARNTLGIRVFEGVKEVQRTGLDEVALCNLALANIGEKPITSLDPPDGSAQSLLCAQYYQIALDTLLEAADWSFSRRRVELVEAPANERDDIWSYAYSLPADFLGVATILQAGVTDTTILTNPDLLPVFELARDIQGNQILYTNEQSAILAYSARVADTTKFTRSFSIAFGWHLASMLAGPLVRGEKGIEVARFCEQQAALYIGRAGSFDKNTQQRQIRDRPQAPWIAGR